MTGPTTIRAAVRVAVAAVLVALALTASPASAADRETEMQARQAFASGRYDQALELFAKLYAETLHPVYLRNIGRCHQKMREPQKAIDTFRDYLAKSKKIGAEERQEIDGYIKEMEALRDEQAKTAKPAEPAPPLATPPPPPPPVLATAPPPPLPPATAATGPSSATMNLTASPPPPAESHPLYTRWWFWTAVGVVVVGGVVAAVALSGGTTRPSCTPDIQGGCK
jgi:hypothetical protein